MNAVEHRIQRIRRKIMEWHTGHDPAVAAELIAGHMPWLVRALEQTVATHAIDGTRRCWCGSETRRHTARCRATRALDRTIAAG